MSSHVRIAIRLIAVVCLLVPAACFTISQALAQDVLWQTLFDAGKSAVQQKNYPEAQTQLTAALKNAEAYGPNDHRVLLTVCQLGQLYAKQGQYGQSRQMYERALNIDRGVNPNDYNAVCTDLRNLAHVCQLASKYDDAENYYQQTLALMHTSGADNSIQHAETLQDLALLHQTEGKYDQVESFLKEALKIYEGAAGNHDRSVADVLDHLANLYVVQNHLTEAEPLYKRASALRQNLSESTKDDPASGLTKIGQLYDLEGKSSAAEDLFKRALQAREQVLGSDSPQLADSLSALAKFYTDQGRNADAVRVFQQSLSIREKKLGEDSPLVAETLNDLARAYLGVYNYSAAEPLMRKALTIDMKSTDKSSIRIAKELSELGQLYLDQGKYAEAEPLYEHALILLQHDQGQESPEAAFALNNLANLYYNWGRLDDAERLLKKGLDIRRKVYGSEHPLVAQNLVNLARVYDRNGKAVEAVPMLKEAISIDKAALGAECSDMVPALWQLGQAYEMQIYSSDAELTYRQLLALDEKLLGADDPALAGDLEALARVLKVEGKTDEAQKLKRRAALLEAQLPGAQHGASGVIDTATVSNAVQCPIKDKWALVVGISNFEDPSINLKYAAKDATDFRNYLISEGNFRPDHIKLLIDKNATHDGIVGNLGDKWLRRLANSDDLVVIYVSSHGSPAQEGAEGKNFIVPYEGTISNVAFTGIPMQWLTATVGSIIHCNRILLVLDVCHGGAVTGGAKALMRTRSIDPSGLQVGAGQVVLASSEADQISWESRNYSNGVFTRRLIEGLRQKGVATTVGEAFNYMKEKIEEEVLRDRAEVQTPVMMTRLWKGKELVLQVKPASPRPALKPLTAEGDNLSPVQTAGVPQSRTSRAGDRQNHIPVGGKLSATR